MTQTIGPYEIRSELGRGAMAVVWRAYDRALEREVAIKEPAIPQGLDPALAAEFSARFVQEGKAAARLSHPGIVTIYSADMYGERPVLVMELIQGESLAEVLSRGPLSAVSTVAILEQLLDAVSYAHDAGVIHRDIKPDNVFVTHDGRVKLADFGIAHMGDTVALTHPGTVLGTPGYMAPEQIRGDPVDARADLFAIGVLGHEMLTGRNPFGASDRLPATTVMYRIVHEPAPHIPETALEGIDIDLRPVLEVALAKDPGARFNDARGFRAALRGEGPLPRPVDPVSRVGLGSAVPVVSDEASVPARDRRPRFAGLRRGWPSYVAVAAIGAIVLTALLLAARTGELDADPVTTVVSAGSTMFSGGGTPVTPNSTVVTTAGETTTVAVVAPTSTTTPQTTTAGMSASTTTGSSTTTTTRPVTSTTRLTTTSATTTTVTQTTAPPATVWPPPSTDWPSTSTSTPPPITDWTLP